MNDPSLQNTFGLFICFVGLKIDLLDTQGPQHDLIQWLREAPSQPVNA